MTDRGDIDRVREATDLVDLVSEVTKIKKSGRTFMAVCPFHQEKTPSMSIDRGRGLYHCFGCGKGGDVFTFVIDTQGVDFGDALEMLARRAGITLVQDPAAAQRRGRRGAAVEAIRRASDVYHQRLKKASEAGPARAYLRNRGYDVDLIDGWKLGFAGVDWDTLTKELKAAGISDQALMDGGLSRRGRHGMFDVFRGRLMFPIHDLRGDPVGFGARKIDDIDPKATNNPDAKYVNSADSIVYHKAQVLFGLDRARRAMGDDTPAVIVEGYTDVIAMHQAGITTAVATCGTALGDGHFDLLRRFSEKVVLAFDSDEAGSKAALRGDELELPFRLDIDLRVAVMPDGLDPADVVQKGRESELVKAVESARPLLEHRIEYEVRRHDLSIPEGKARAVQTVASFLARIGNQSVRSDYAAFTARKVGVERDLVEAAARGESISPILIPDPDRPLDRFESDLLRVAVMTGELDELTEDDFSDARLKAAFVAVAPSLGSGSEVDVSKVADPVAQGLLRSLVLDKAPLASGPEMFARVRGRRLEAEIDRVETELEDLGSDSDAYSDTLRRLVALQQEKRTISES